MSGPVFSVIVNGPFSSDTWSPTSKLEVTGSFTNMSRCVCFDLVGIGEDEIAGALRVMLWWTSSQRIKRLLGFFGAKVGGDTLIDEIDGICL